MKLYFKILYLKNFERSIRCYYFISFARKEFKYYSSEFLFTIYFSVSLNFKFWMLMHHKKIYFSFCVHQYSPLWNRRNKSNIPNLINFYVNQYFRLTFLSILNIEYIDSASTHFCWFSNEVEFQFMNSKVPSNSFTSFLLELLYPLCIRLLDFLSKYDEITFMNIFFGW